MPIFSTPEPIDLAINLPVGSIEVIATDRDDTLVTVTPASDKPSDKRGAEETKVVLDGSRLTITAPKPRFSIIGPSESINVVVELPTGSRVTAEISVGAVRTRGRLGATRVKSGLGPVDLDETGDVWMRVGHGSGSITTADGSVELTADHGQIRIGAVTGTSVLKASHGSVTIGQAGGDVEAKLSYGDLSISTAQAGVTAKTAYGTITIDQIEAGALDLESGYGGIRLGVRAGVAAWLDVSSKNGRVRSSLQSDPSAAESSETVTVRARTQWGDIDIERNA